MGPMRPVDLALCLAVDVSASVDFDEFALMLGGFAGAFRDPVLQALATGGPRGAVAVAALFWSEGVDVALPWTLLDGPEAAEAIAAALLDAPRLPRPGATALGAGLAAALALLARCPAEATRQVVDVSGDGRSNRGPEPGPVRDLAVRAGVTVNGLAILNEEPDLLAHYREEVIGGRGSFAMECRDYEDFADAIRRKLAREIRGEELAA
jgi:hypothetical protein